MHWEFKVTVCFEGWLYGAAFRSPNIKNRFLFVLFVCWLELKILNSRRKTNSVKTNFIRVDEQHICSLVAFTVQETPT